MGQVYRGYDQFSGEAVAIKVLKPEQVSLQPDVVARFKREGEALRQLNHPNIVKMLAAITEPEPESGKEIHYLVMEYVRGGSLRELLEQEVKLPVKRCLKIGVELADALARAHHLGIIHRDIKPDNVLLAEDGTPRLTDFGIAYLAGLPQITQEGAIMGTIQYLSPEACNSKKLDAQTDIWAFGVMLFEMLAGVVPFNGDNLFAIITSILTEATPDLLKFCPEAPPPLAELIGQMLEKEPENRVSSARFVAAQLEAILKNQNLQHVPPAAKPQVAPEISAPSSISVEYPQDLTSTARRNKHILLEKVKNFWIAGVLEKAAPDVDLLEIPKRSVNPMIERPWDEVVSVKVDSGESVTLNKDINEIFYEADRSLLILGESGAGKTITLLKVARSLIELAEHDPSQPVPVVLSFASWGEKRTSIEEWVTNELTTKYQIPRKIGRVWMDDNALILLMDDLDEIPSRYLPDAIHAINEFRENYGLTGIILCSQVNAYVSAGVRLKFGGAIELQPLTLEQVDSYLAKRGPPGEKLRATIQKDAALIKISQSPLWLNVMCISYQDERFLQVDPDIDKANLTDSALHRQRLIHSYIRYAFQRRSAGGKYSPEKITELLCWLAKKMDQHNQALFLIEDIQPSWLPSRILRRVFSLGEGLVLGLTNAITVFLAVLGFSQNIPFGPLLMNNLYLIFLVDIPIGLMVGILQDAICERARRLDKPAVSTTRQRWLRSIACGIISIPIFLVVLIILGVNLELGLFLSSWSGTFYTIGTLNIGTTYRNTIETVEAVSWSWKEALRGLVPGVIIGVVFALVTSLNDFGVFLKSLLLWVSPFTLGFLLTGGLKGRRIEKTSRPNQGIWLSTRNAIVMGGIVGLVLGIFFWLFQGAYHTGALFSVFLGLMTCFSLAMTYGVGIVGHYMLRLLLSIGEKVPFVLVDSLNHAASLVLLRKVGGGYIFTHRILLNYFSSEYKPLLAPPA